MEWRPLRRLFGHSAGLVYLHFGPLKGLLRAL
jgi:hypothetical protein